MTDPAADWRRLDTRMLLVHPVNELVRFLPLLIGVLVLGSSSDGVSWELVGVVVPIAIGLWRFASTTFRITEAQIELRRGLLGRRVLTAPLDRVRTVELTATPIHRVLGLARVEVGTGSGSRQGEGRLVLDSLGVADGRRLRARLLDRAGAEATGSAWGEGTDPDSAAALHDGEPIMRLDPSWVRFAPLTTSGLVVALAALGAGSQVLDNLVGRLDQASGLDESVAEVPLAIAVPTGLLAFAVLTSALAIGGYVLGNWGFVLSRTHAGRSFHVRRGLLTTRETTLDVERLRGLELHEPLGLRLGGGRWLAAIATGLSRDEAQRTTLVPAAPRDLVLTVGEHVLGEAGPLTVPLIEHGPGARRRRYLRAVVPATCVPLALGLLAAFADWPLWLAVLALAAPLLALPLAADRYAGLGHALTARHLVVRSGSLQGRRDALQRSGIIGWNVSQSWFQRRAGLVTLTATTAAGRQAYRVLDVPEPVALALADAAVPGLLTPWLDQVDRSGPEQVAPPVR